MRTRLLISLIIMPFILSLSSCDEFLLKKTVTVLSIHGELKYEPQLPQITGTIQYNIKNSQETDLKEVYLICHPQVELIQVLFNNKKSAFEIGEGLGDKVYRVKIPNLEPGKGAQLSLKFNIQGNFREDRFLLSQERVFFDVKKIWLPVPFADHFEFPYEMKVTCPDTFYSIMGAKIYSESVKNNIRSITWKSEINNALVAGSLHILPYTRYQDKNTFYYSQTSNNIDIITDYAHFSQKTLKKGVGYIPFSEYHFINLMYPYPKMKEIIDGEYLANNILLAPSLCDYTQFSKERDLLKSPIPFVPNTSEVKLLEVIAHEVAHSYISTLLRFEDEYNLNMEALTEFIAIEVMRKRNHKFQELMQEKNRILLINLALQKKHRSTISKYLYMVNTLESSFWNNYHWTSRYLGILIDKYRFSEIQWTQLVTTLEDINRTLSKDTNNTLLNIEVMENWKNPKLYNFSLSSTEVMTTNLKAAKWKRIQKKKKVLIKSHFPYVTDSILISYTPTNTYTNHIILDRDSSTNILLGKNTITTKLVSRFALLETHLGDNQINYKDRSWQDLILEINRFYKGENYNTRFVSISKDDSDTKLRTDDAAWNNLYQDRIKSQNISPHVYLQFDQVYFNKKEFYIEAYKWINNKAYSYVIIKGRILNNRLEVQSILDPSL